MTPGWWMISGAPAVPATRLATPTTVPWWCWRTGPCTGRTTAAPRRRSLTTLWLRSARRTLREALNTLRSDSDETQSNTLNTSFRWMVPNNRGVLSIERSIALGLCPHHHYYPTTHHHRGHMWGRMVWVQWELLQAFQKRQYMAASND